LKYFLPFLLATSDAQCSEMGSGSGMGSELEFHFVRERDGVEVEKLVGTGTGSGFGRDTKCFLVVLGENYSVEIRMRTITIYENNFLGLEMNIPLLHFA
jgi:hypothetical protein